MNSWHPEVQTLRRWATKGGLAVLDQGLFSGANFLVNILLARWLPPEEYGAFTVALSVFYLLAGFHTAVLTEPMMVFGAGKYREYFRKYLGILLWGHWAISALIALVLGIAALVMARLGSAPMAQGLAGLAVASPFLLLLWLVRRAPYVEMRPGWAVVGSGVNFLVTLVGVFLLWRHGLLSSLSGLVLLGVAGAVASLALLLHIRPQVVRFVGNPTPGMVATHHWDYGRWLILQTFVYWVFSDAILPVLTVFQGLAITGVFRAYQNLFLPIFQFLTAISLLVLPAAVRRYHAKGDGGLRQIAFIFTVFCVLSTSLYAFFVFVLRRPLVSFLLGEEYLAYVDLLSVWLLGPVILALGRGAEIVARVLERPQIILYSYVAGAVMSLVLFLLLVPPFGLWGAVYTQILSFGVQMGALLLMAAYSLPSSYNDASHRQDGKR